MRVRSRGYASGRLDLSLPTTITALPSLRALRHRDYRSIFFGSLVSNVGTWMETIGVGIYVTEETRSAGWTGAVAAAMFLPTTVMAPLGGALTDRFDRQRYISLLTLAQTALAGVLALLALTHHLSVPAVMCVVFASGCVSALINPAFTAVLADVVPPEDLLSALSLSSAQYNMGRFIGPALAAVVIAAGGLGWAFVCNTLSFFAVLWAVSVVHVPPPEHGHARESLWRNIRDGVQAARAAPAIPEVLALVGAVAFLVAPFIGLLPAFAIEVLHQDAARTSLLVTFQGLGAVVAALSLGSITARLGSGRTFAKASLAVGVVAAVYWLAPTYAIAAGLLFLLGATYLAMLTSASTAIQSRVSRGLRGRVSALYAVVLNGAYGLGLVALGALGDKVGLRVAMVSAAAIFVIGVAILRVKHGWLFRQLDAPPVITDPSFPVAPLPGAKPTRAA